MIDRCNELLNNRQTDTQDRMNEQTTDVTIDRTNETPTDRYTDRMNETE